MYQFTTENGTTYTVEQGRLTRDGDAIHDHDGFVTDERIVADPFTLTYRGVPTSAPTIGERFFFTRSRGNLGIRTGRVVRITTGGWNTSARGQTIGDLLARIASIPTVHDVVEARRARIAHLGCSIDVDVANRIIDAYAAGQPGAR